METLLKLVIGSVLAIGCGAFLVNIWWEPKTADTAIHKNYYVIGLLLVIALAAVGLWAMIKF
jgi:hypothetical protein